MFIEERHEKILEAICANGKITVAGAKRTLQKDTRRRHRLEASWYEAACGQGV